MQGLQRMAAGARGDLEAARKQFLAAQAEMAHIRAAAAGGMPPEQAPGFDPDVNRRLMAPVPPRPIQVPAQTSGGLRIHVSRAMGEHAWVGVRSKNLACSSCVHEPRLAVLLSTSCTSSTASIGQHSCGVAPRRNCQRGRQRQLAVSGALSCAMQVLSPEETWDYWAAALAQLLHVCDVARCARWADLKPYLLDCAATLPGALARSALHCAVSGRRPGPCGGCAVPKPWRLMPRSALCPAGAQGPAASAQSLNLEP